VSGQDGPIAPPRMFDYWHLRRILRIRGHDEDLPFGEWPLVLGSIVAMREPIWRSVVATAAAHGVIDPLAHWTQENPLQPVDAAMLAELLRPVVEIVEQTRGVIIAPDIAPDTLPDPQRVRDVLGLLVLLLELAAAERREAETWVE